MDRPVHNITLFTDNYGVTHWKYEMRGILLVCGKEQYLNSSFKPEPGQFPMCIQCIAMVDRELDKGPL